MNRLICIALLVGGIGLMVFGINATNSFSSDVSKFACSAESMGEFFWLGEPS